MYLEKVIAKKVSNFSENNQVKYYIQNNKNAKNLPVLTKGGFYLFYFNQFQSFYTRTVYVTIVTSVQINLWLSRSWFSLSFPNEGHLFN
jgi:hypothetical protein